jgi:hypothetical protein
MGGFMARGEAQVGVDRDTGREVELVALVSEMQLGHFADPGNGADHSLGGGY